MILYKEKSGYRQVIYDYICFSNIGLVYGYEGTYYRNVDGILIRKIIYNKFMGINKYLL